MPKVTFSERIRKACKILDRHVKFSVRMQFFSNLKLVNHCKTNFIHIIISFFRKYCVFCRHNVNKATKMIKLFRKAFSLNAKRSHHIPMISIKYLSVQEKKDLVQAHACACQSSNQMSAEGESC